MTENAKCVVCLTEKVQRMLAETSVRYGTIDQAAEFAMTGFQLMGTIKAADFQVEGTSMCAPHAHAAYTRYEITEDE